MTVQGFCAPRFRSVQEEFERNFAARGELGAGVCALVDGEPVVDLWGGSADRHSGRPWERDTLVLVWSCTKGAVALCAHILNCRGQLDFDAPVARYWPEFARAGKDAIPVRWLLNHQSGLSVLRTPLRPGGLYNWDYFIQQLAAEAPVWPPGTRQGYHATTFGHLVGEVVRRAAGKPLDVFFREEVADPLGLDFFLGLRPADENRVSPTIRPDVAPPGEPVSHFLARANADPQSPQAFVVQNTGRLARPRDHDTPAAHQAVLPSQGGITNARGLAGLYAPLSLGGALANIRLVDEGTLSRMAAVSSASPVDGILLVGLRFTLGFVKSSDNRAAPPGARDSLLLSEEAFGHPGMGGSVGFADPKARLAFGYVMNKQGRGVLLNDRGQALVDAVYRALGYRTNQYGTWI